LRTIAAQIGALLEARRQIERLKREACGVLVDRPVSLLSRGVHPDPLGKAYEDLLRDPGARVAVAAVGIDAVRLVDESLGHGAGDALMAACVERIVKSVRSTETVARYGDSQIVVILQDVKDSIAATTIAKRILRLFEESVDIEGYALRIRASVGMTMMDAGHRHLIDLIREASSAMYHATSLGEVSIALFTPMLHDIAVNRLRMEGEIRRAIDAREFCLFYQPIFALTTMTLVGFEALVRWQHPKRGLVMPDQFIRIAEETGLIEPIGEWVLREACRQLSAWRRQYPLFAELAVSVNVSAKQFRNDRLFDVVTDALSDAQLDASCLRIEITETVLMEQSDTAVETLLRLRELGVSAHLDDFGCGYSSLNYLKNFPVSTLKIDRSFISSSGVRIANREIVQAVIALAGALDVEIVAEGIETREQLEQLQELGCAHGQGYLLSKPLSAGDALPFAIARSGKQTVELQHSATV
ncbi:MAG: bifunctional diguanylate cyclase/phosphodiesterase, partial [Candidatus Eremiobacteraeota bacterium]|nr:bifunctional diguanylate cyclase/phosphodiesterase [Candidatus Eremiobacteraeota bacterium]